MIFSIFGKKDKEDAPSSPEKNSARKKNDKEPGREADSERSSQQRKAAQATAKKIDAIEFEMSSEFVKPRRPSSAGEPAPKPRSQPRPAPQPASGETRRPTGGLSTLGPTTSSLTLGGSTLHGDAYSTTALAQSESAPILEEAAILFANNQIEMAEHALQSALHDDSLGNLAVTAWRMLFDLYQAANRQEDFDRLSIEFASKFETSPPSWIEAATDSSAAPESTSAKALPIVAFSGKLDNTIIKQVEKAQNLAAKSQSLRLEFAKVAAVDPVGCGILLSVLKKLQKSGNDLILVGALELVEKIRSILEVGRRVETEAPWLLMLELLRLLNLEKEFEEASIDYCVTFEVSPPPFIAPQNKVTTEIESKAEEEPAETESFAMPAVIDGKTDQLIASINLYITEHPLAILDCSRLTRVDFNAAAQLLSGLAPFSAKGAQIELHDVSQLVAVLLQTMGMHEMFRITHRKH